jgi:hypothetical protein
MITLVRSPKPVLCLLLLGLASALMVRGSKAPTVVGNLVWNDLNRNGIQDKDEPGVNGIMVKAINATNDQVIATQVTQQIGGAEGIYSFALESPGAIYLQFELPPTFQFTIPKQGSNDAVDSDVDRISGRTSIINLDRSTTGRIQPNWDAGVSPKLFEEKELTGELRPNQANRH